MAYRIDLTTRNASIAIVLGLDVLFFAAAIGASVQPAFADLSTKLWGLFAGTKRRADARSERERRQYTNTSIPSSRRCIMRRFHPRFQERALRSRRKFKPPAWFMPFVKVAVFAVPFAFLCVCLGLAGLEARKATVGLEATDEAAKNFIVDTQQQVHVVGNNTNHLIVEAGLTAKEARLAATSQRQFWDN
jgi:hypothetical protein